MVSFASPTDILVYTNTSKQSGLAPAYYKNTLKATKDALKNSLGSHYKIKEITREGFLKEGWEKNTALLVFPSNGLLSEIQKDLAIVEEGPENSMLRLMAEGSPGLRVSNYVREYGGKFLGIGSGAVLAALSVWSYSNPCRGPLYLHAGLGLLINGRSALDVAILRGKNEITKIKATGLSAIDPEIKLGKVIKQVSTIAPLFFYDKDLVGCTTLAEYKSEVWLNDDSLKDKTCGAIVHLRRSKGEILLMGTECHLLSHDIDDEKRRKKLDDNDILSVWNACLAALGFKANPKPPIPRKEKDDLKED